MKKTSQRRLLFRWTGWFFLTLSIILFLIQLSFLQYLPNLHHIYGSTTLSRSITYGFLFASYITQACIIAFTAALFTLLIAALVPKKWLIFSLAIFLSGSLIVLQGVDFLVYNIYHSHEIMVGTEVIKTNTLNDVIPLSFNEIAFLLGSIAIVMLIQTFIGWQAWRYITKKQNHHKAPIWITSFILVCFCFSYGVMSGVLSVPQPYQFNDRFGLLILKAARAVPYYSELYESIMPISHPYQRTIQTSEGAITYQTRQPILPMQYPKKTLHCIRKKALPNFLFLIIDTWRFDAMNASVTPNIYHFSPKTLQFKDHWSGGNSTQTGIFTLFYSIPENYWEAVLKHKKGPAFLDLLQKKQYQLTIHTSAPLNFPAFDKTVFVHVPNLELETPGKTTLARDRETTREFLQFLKSRHPNKPFFGILLYDAGHNYCGGGPNVLQTPFKPAIKNCVRFSLNKQSDPIPYLNRYRNAIHFVDAQIGQVLAALKDHGLYKNTIIVITSDHGEQFNDEHLGFWGHNSAYSPYQLHVPLLIYWPGKSASTISHFSTHYEIVPTLLKQALYCTDPASNFSMGRTLFEPIRSTYTICGSYTNYAILTKARDTTFYKNGAYSIKTLSSQPIPYARMNALIVKKANKELDRFYR